jgi:Flp pilus assembly protein TadD
MRNGPQTLTSRFLLPLALAAQLLFWGAGITFASQGKDDALVQAGKRDPLQQGLKALQDNRLEDALRYLTAAEDSQPADARIRNFRGIVLVRLGQNNEAATEYREAIRLDPKLEDGYKNLGFLEWTEHRLESARARLQRAVELAPDDSFAHYYLGRVQLDGGLYQSAFQELDRSGLKWPEDPQFLIEAANGYVALGRQEKAREIIDRLSTMRLSDSQIADVAQFLLSHGDDATAIELLRRLSERKNSARPQWAQFDLALSYLRAGNFEEAAAQSQELLDTWQSAEAPAGERASAWCILGVAKARIGQSVGAVDAFRQATKLNPKQEEYWLNLTRELMDLSRYAEALSDAQEGLKSNPKSYALNLRLGAAFLSIDRYPEAESVFRQLVVAGDPLPTSYVGLAQILLRTGRAAEAVSELADARKKLGPNFLISYFQGLALDRAARPSEAISAFQEAVQLNPNSSDAHLGLGKTDLQLGRINDAIVELKKSVQLSPGNVQARRLLSQAYRRAGDTKAASRYSGKTEAVEPTAQNDLLGDFILPDWQSPHERPIH